MLLSTAAPIGDDAVSRGKREMEDEVLGVEGSGLSSSHARHSSMDGALAGQTNLVRLWHLPSFC